MGAAPVKQVVQGRASGTGRRGPQATFVRRSIVPTPSIVSNLLCILTRKQNTSFLFKTLRVCGAGLGSQDTWICSPFPLVSRGVRARECVWTCVSEPHQEIRPLEAQGGLQFSALVT